MPSTRRLSFLVLLVPTLLALVAPVAAEDDVDLVDSKTRRLVERVAKDLAAEGRSEDMSTVLDVLSRLGHPAAAMKKLEKVCDRAFTRSKPSESRRKTIRKRIGEAVEALTEQMQIVAADRQPELARQILRLDGSVGPAHEMLEHVEVDGVWLPREKAHTREGAATVRGILLRAKNRVFFVERGESAHPLFHAVYARKANKVSWENVEVHGCLPHDRLERILREALRARSVSAELLTGSHDVKKLGSARTFLLFHSQVSYEAALEEAVAKGTLPADRLVPSKELAGAWVEHGKVMAIRLNAEMPALAIMLYHMSDWHGSASRRVQPTLRAGHINWVCLNVFGVPMPGIGWIEEVEVAANAASTTTAHRRRREQIHRMAKAGIVGCRSWMVYLAERRQDPAWTDTMVGVIGTLRGTPLLKATMVVAYLQEQDRLAALIRQTARPEKDGAVEADPGIFEAALETDLASFEEGWRRWLLPPDAGVLARLEEGGPVRMSDNEFLAVGELDRIRAVAFEGRKLGEYERLLVEPELSAGARAHALYLAKHPEQLAAWPDAHEEWPDREGFSVAGSAAGLHSVIAPDVRTPQGAIAGWMATFYHRMPLLDPGLLAIGWGCEKGIGVLDSGSLAEPRESDEIFVVWPADGAKDVPLRFRSELPNPVPGESQAAWGYPITIQGGLYDPALTFTLYLGKPDPRNLVDCHVSTPWSPTNPDLAPDGAACLIPKSPLKPGATYTAVVENLPKGQRIEWTFRTGRP